METQRTRATQLEQLFQQQVSGTAPLCYCCQVHTLFVHTPWFMPPWCMTPGCIPDWCITPLGIHLQSLMQCTAWHDMQKQAGEGHTRLALHSSVAKFAPKSCHVMSYVEV